VWFQIGEVFFCLLSLLRRVLLLPLLVFLLHGFREGRTVGGIKKGCLTPRARGLLSGFLVHCWSQYVTRASHLFDCVLMFSSTTE
jgi:hypothetical protein